MGRAMDGNNGRTPPSSGVEKAVERAEHEARMVGRLADLKIGSSQLFLQTTEQTRMALSIADPHQDDCPLVYCNQAFVDLTGYDRDEIIGRNCRFLQGRGTKPSAVVKLAEAVRSGEYTVVDILNYRKDGSSFWNAVHVGPIYDENGDLAYLFGSQWDITELLAARETIVENERVAEELRHRTDDLFAVLVAIVRLSARNSQDVGELSSKIERRVEALAGAHRVSLAAEGLNHDRSNLRDLVEAVMRPYRSARGDRIDLGGELIELPRKHVTPLGLTLHELATNALKYGALAHQDGKVTIDWEVAEGTLVIEWEETRGQGAIPLAANPEIKGTGSGTRLIEGVIRGLGGGVEMRFEPTGFQATIRVPAAARALD
ncbi:MAG: PAS domain-containing protein [Erythrobacter sp.]|jgi:PAS domain S-box-containing protein|uniref:PAS domain-containing protein n=1 Tax=Qipengyuania citrea TaxID=225971 RepID=UPI001A53508B|nr:PAS domain-containing protein [Qipengyuania citrea]MBL4718075.1 PAS domain-containing protein [Erythrobacter sp.]MCP2016935.1 PAS domain S-box-containing protein [Qipengyuania citrea]MDE0900982.1 PAS domain-containing protein [Erythrobacter sp.]